MLRIDTISVASAAVAACAAGIVGANGCFGILDNTGDELADLLGVDEVPPLVVSTVRMMQPVYEPLKAVSPSCTEALYPEFNEVNDWNDCSLLRRRVFWRRGVAPPLLIQQTMSTRNMWKSSTGSAVWGGGIVLGRQLEEMGRAALEGKRVLELGTGTGLGAITAAKLGATVLATDRDPTVLELAATNARTNGVALATAPLTWGTPTTVLYERGEGAKAEAPTASPVDEAWDVLIGADLTYNREAWPALFQTIQAARTPSGEHTPMLLSASERRHGEAAGFSARGDEPRGAALRDRALADGHRLRSRAGCALLGCRDRLMSPCMACCLRRCSDDGAYFSERDASL